MYHPNTSRPFALPDVTLCFVCFYVFFLFFGFLFCYDKPVYAGLAAGKAMITF